MHPAGKHLLLRLVGAVVRDLHESGRLGRFARRRGITVARRNGKRRESDGHADRRKDVRGPPGDLVEAAQHECAFDAVFAGHRIVEREALFRIALRQRGRTDQCNAKRKAATEREDLHLPPELP
jgi:hypothetical protein